MVARTLYQFTLSPYCIKVRRILECKRLAYRTIEVNPLTRGEVRRISGQARVPVLVETADGGQTTVVADSTAIAVHLDEVAPEPAVYPSDPSERARVALLEDWADETFARDLIPFKMLTPGNARRMVEQSKVFYPKRWYDGLIVPLGPLYLRRIGARLARGRTLARLREDYERDLDHLDAMAAPGAFLSVERPTAFEFAVWGFLRTMEGLDGRELLDTRANLRRWYVALGGSC